MKKLILLTYLFAFTVFAFSQTKLYKNGAFVQLEQSDGVEMVFNPAQTTYRAFVDFVYIIDNIRQINKQLYYSDLADQNGTYYNDKAAVLAFLNSAFDTQSNNDVSGRPSLNSIFGDQIVGSRVISIAAQFQYGLEEGTALPVLENGGTVVLEESLLKIKTTADPASRASIKSVETVRYVPGCEVFCYFTAVFDTAKLNSYQRVGLYDDYNGFYVGYEDTTFMFTRRRDSVMYSMPIDLDLFKQINGYTFNTTRGNIYRISYGYLGYAPVTLEVMKPNGGFVKLAQIKYPNNHTVTHTTQTFLPVRGELANTGNTTAMELWSGSLSAGIVDGAGDDVAGRRFNYSNDAAYIVNTNTTIAAFRNRSTFNSIENKIVARLLLISGSNDLNKNARWKIYKNPTFTNTPTWNYVDENNSVLEYSEDAIVNLVASEETFIAWNVSKLGDFFEFVEQLELDLPPNGIAAFVLETTGTGEADLSISWNELF